MVGFLRRKWSVCVKRQWLAQFRSFGRPKARNTSNEFRLQVPLGRNGKITVAVDTWTLDRRFRTQGIYIYVKEILSHFRQLAAQGPLEIRPFVSAAASNDANGFSPAPGFRPQE